MTNLINLLEQNKANNNLYAHMQSSTNTQTNNQPKQHLVVKGDNLYNIAKYNNIPLNELIAYNPQLNGKTLIRPNDVLNLEKVDYNANLARPKPDKSINSPFIQGLAKDEYEIVDLLKEKKLEEEWNRDNVTAIQQVKHDQNYIIVDKAGKRFTVYDKYNTPIATTTDISTGASGNDYNTVTYQNKGKLINGEGNNSTPAGITMIDGIGTYHGAPSFTRTRIDPQTKKPIQVNPWELQQDGTYKENKDKLVNDQIASSIHVGDTSRRNSSNGCIRMGKKTLEALTKLVGPGTMVYTLPQQGESKFVFKGGSLNYVANNPYGKYTKDDKSPQGRSMERWDDYNTFIDKSYKPLIIKDKLKEPILKHDNSNLDEVVYYLNRQAFIKTLEDNKQQLQKEFNLTSSQYNDLAMLALGMAQQESKFGTSAGYKVKTALPFLIPELKRVEKLAKKEYKKGITPWETADKAISYIKGAAKYLVTPNEDIPVSVNSRGYGQIKMEADNEKTKAYYKKYGLTPYNVNNPKNSAMAIMLRLGSMYNDEIKGREFRNYKNEVMSPMKALAYKYNGRDKALKNQTYSPIGESYARKITNYSKQFDYYEKRKK